MNLDEVNATIRELESQIASYEFEISQTSHSTPVRAPSGGNQATDSGFATSNALDGTDFDEKSGAKRKSVRFGQSIENTEEAEKDEFDLSPYLIKDEQETPRKKPENPMCNVTFRRKSKIPSPKMQVQHTTSERDTSPSQPFRGRQHTPNIKPATYDGSTSWLDYKSHFEACAKLGNWDETEKGLYLSVSLRGSAQGVLGNLSDGNEMSYKELISALSDRFAPPDQVDLYRAQLKERRQKASESLPELGQQIRRLVNLAYPTVPADVKETLAKDHFIDALAISDIRLRIKQARPKNLNEAVRNAIELEAFLKTEQRLGGVNSSLRAVGQETTRGELAEELKVVNDTVLSLQISMTSIIEELKELKQNHADHGKGKWTKAPEWRKNAACYNCGKTGHLQRECRSKRKAQNDNANHATQRETKQSKEPYKTKSPEKVGITGDAGIFVKSSINGFDLNILVDTGATLSLVAKRVYDRLLETNSSFENLREVSQPVLSAKNDPLTIYGKLNVLIFIGNNLYNTEVVVTELTVDAIIGLDFLIRNKCVVNLKTQILEINGKSISLNKAGHIGCYRVAVADTIHMAPRSETVLSCNVCISAEEPLPKGLGIIEGDDDFLKSERAIIGKVLVTNQRSVPCRLMNPSPEVQVNHSGTVVANLTPVDGIIQEHKVPMEQNNECPKP